MCTPVRRSAAPSRFIHRVVLNFLFCVTMRWWWWWWWHKQHQQQNSGDDTRHNWVVQFYTSNTISRIHDTITSTEEKSRRIYLRHIPPVLSSRVDVIVTLDVSHSSVAIIIINRISFVGENQTHETHWCRNNRHSWLPASQRNRFVLNLGHFSIHLDSEDSAWPRKNWI